MRTVLHSLDYVSDRPGSFIKAIEKLVAALAAEGGSHSIVAIPRAAMGAPWIEGLRAAGAEVVGTARPAEIGRIIHSRRPNVVHTHFNAYVVPATLAALTRDCRVYWHVHSALAPQRPGMKQYLRRLKFGALARRTARIFAVSGELAESLAHAGAPRPRVQVVENGVDCSRFRPPSKDERSRARAALGLAAQDRAVLFFGRDAHVKGADVLADAMRLCGEPLTVLCVDAPSGVRDLFGGAHRIVSLGQVDDVRGVVWACDALAMPSRLEGLPLTLLEARASAVPAAVSHIRAFDAFAAADAGTIQARGEGPVAFAAALRGALQLGPSPLSDALRERYSLERWCERLMEAYDAH